jgi:hypothetical protein
MEHGPNTTAVEVEHISVTGHFLFLRNSSARAEHHCDFLFLAIAPRGFAPDMTLQHSLTQCPCIMPKGGGHVP